MASDADGNVDNKGGNGTGPYSVVDFNPGVRALFKRNPNYFKSDRAHFDEVEHLVLLDPTARQTALTSGVVEVIDNVDPTALCQDVTVKLNGSGFASISGSDVDNGSTDNCSVASLSVSPNTFNTSNIGNNTVTLTVTDPSGNTATCTANVTVEDDNPPTANCVGGLTVTLDQNGFASIDASGVDNGSTDNVTGVLIKFRL